MVTLTLITPNIELDNNFSLSFSAIDGTFHEIFTEEGVRSFVVVGIVKGKVKSSSLDIEEIEISKGIYEGSGENAMRVAEYEEARKAKSDIVLMDRKISFDTSLGIIPPKRYLGIVKDFDPNTRKELQANDHTPWIKSESKSELRQGYFRLYPYSWVFMFETNILDDSTLLKVLTIMGNVPVPEALGYNYPLFLADKLVKYYRDKEYRGIELLLSPSRYRDFRGLVEHLRHSSRFY